MKKLLSIAVAAAFAASSFAVVAQDKKKDDVKSAGGGVKSAGGAAVTTADTKPKDTKGAALPTPEGKRKTEAQRTDKKDKK